jgi:hypothetical protein
MKKSVLIDAISCLYIFLYIYTGVNKILDLHTFKSALLRSPLLKFIAPELSIFIPILELIIATFLVLPLINPNTKFKRLGLFSATILMGIFTVYIGYMLYFSSDRPCSCGGIISLMNWHQHLYFNSICTLLGLIGIWLNKVTPTTDHKDISFTKLEGQKL